MGEMSSNLNMRVSPGVTGTGGGTSDARFMQRICPVFEFGTINKTLHKVNECVSIDDLKTTEKIYYKTLENFFR